MPNWKAILFDLDDTLFPEREFVESGFRAVANYLEETREFPCENVHQELIAIFDQSPRPPVLDAWIARHGLPDSGLREQLVDIYRHHRPRIQLRAGMRSLLEALRPTCQLGLISDGRLATQENKLAALNVASLFQTIIFSDRWGRPYWKPHRRPYGAALEELALTPAEAVYVGDNPLKDFAACRAMGMDAVWLRLPDGLYRGEEPPTPAHQPTWIVEEMVELQALLLP